MIKNYKKTMKTLVFSLVLAALTLTANHLNAQDGGLFGLGKPSTDYNYSSSESLMRQGEPATINGGFQNDSFGAPLGSGIAILLGAGLSYVALKKKEDRQ